MWRALDADGQLANPNFSDIVVQLTSFYWLRVVGGVLYLFGALLMSYNLGMTMAGRNGAFVDAPAAK